MLSSALSFFFLFVCFVLYFFTHNRKRNHHPKVTEMRVSMGLWLLRLSAKILALLRLLVNIFQLRLTKKLKINFFCFKELNKCYFF